MFDSLCAAVGFGAVESGTVGYSAVNDGGYYNPGIGGLFIPLNGASTYKLSSITVSGDGEFMVPGNEYLQMLNPNGSAVIARYTYVSEDFLQDEFEDEWENYKDAVGWWNWDRDIPSLIENGDYAKKITAANDPDIAIGTAFLGSLGGNNLNFTSAGEVPSTSTAFNDAGNFNPFFMNYLPVAIDLMDVTVSGATATDFMVPGNEYLQVLNPNGSAVTARYTYVSQAFLEDEFEDEWEDYTWAIGWWNWDRDIPALIEANNSTKKIARGDVTLAPGASFLGSLGGNGLNFNFPAAL